MTNFCINIAVLFLVHIILPANAIYRLEFYSTLYLPASYDDQRNPMYEYGGDAIEHAVYDNKEDIVYTAGKSLY